MIDSFDMKFLGLDELDDAMKALPDKTKDAVLKSVNLKLAKKFIVDRLRVEVAPYGERAVKSVKTTGSRSDKTAVIAGPTSSAFWVRYLDLGAVRETKGTIVGQDRIGPAIDSQIEPIALEWSNEVGNIIMQTIEKRIKSGERKLGLL